MCAFFAQVAAAAPPGRKTTTERAGRSLRAPPRVRDSTGAGGENRGGAREREKKKDKKCCYVRASSFSRPGRREEFLLQGGRGGGGGGAQVKSGGGGGGRERLGQSPLLSNLDFQTLFPSASLEDPCFPNSYSPKKNCIYINVMLQQWAKARALNRPHSMRLYEQSAGRPALPSSLTHEVKVPPVPSPLNTCVFRLPPCSAPPAEDASEAPLRTTATYAGCLRHRRERGQKGEPWRPQTKHREKKFDTQSSLMFKFFKDIFAWQQMMCVRTVLGWFFIVQVGESSSRLHT